MTETLDATKKQKVEYCIPLWLRDDQIRHACRAVTERFVPVKEPRTDPVAIVGYGPSLRETWEKIRDYRYIVTCSGSHRFLIDRGIIPTWHVEVDPRDHKIALLGDPHPDVEYLTASTCHPRYFQHLSGFKVRLWHIFDATEEGRRLLPAGEWLVTGGCDAGLRAMTMASLLGFRDLHVFGLDGCAVAEGAERHAGEHPNGKQKYKPCEYGGRTYWTTPGMLEAARQVGHELNQMPAVKATFHGDGLIQAMMADYVPAPNPAADVVAVLKPELISAHYREQNAQLHRENMLYGVGGDRHADVVLTLIQKLNTRSVLDYGCGKGLLGRALAQKNIPIWEYDPAIPGKDESPRPADLVVCTDVLEHIEPENLHAVLGDLQRVVRKVGYFTIHTGPAQKTLPDGRNTHLIQQGHEWWDRTLSQFFQVGKIAPMGAELHVVVGRKAA